VDQERLEDSVTRHPSGLDGEAAARRRLRNRWIAVSAVLAAVVLLTALFAFGLRRNPAALDDVLVGRQAPGFDLPTLAGGGTVNLDDLRGQVVVVNFWASWCVPCRQEHSALDAAWDRYRDRGVVVVGVLYNDRPANGRAFVEELGGDWPVVDDPDSATALAYGVYGVPETFFIAPDGRVAHRHIGAVDYELLTERIEPLLREEATAA
jgi:cytochrome c biogenesis protein CcmG, thiol:disulfide interchange protein DsbE